MANLQQITLTVDELTQPGTMLYPADGYEAIESVTFSGLWDYWYNDYEWITIDGVDHGAIHLDSNYFLWAYPELEGTWTEYQEEIFLNSTTFNPVLASKNDSHSSSRCGLFSFMSNEGYWYDYDTDIEYQLPPMRWRLVEASRFTSTPFIRVFTETTLTAADLQGGVVLKFLGTSYLDSTNYGCRGSYYAYFVNSPNDPSYFYLLGLESTAPGRIDPTLGDYVDLNQPNVINTINAGQWWSAAAYDPMLYIKYLDQEITY